MSNEKASVKLCNFIQGFILVVLLENSSDINEPIIENVLNSVFKTPFEDLNQRITLFLAHINFIEGK